MLWRCLIIEYGCLEFEYCVCILISTLAGSLAGHSFAARCACFCVRGNPVVHARTTRELEVEAAQFYYSFTHYSTSTMQFHASVKPVSKRERGRGEGHGRSPDRRRRKTREGGNLNLSNFSNSSVRDIVINPARSHDSQKETRSILHCVKYSTIVCQFTQ